MPREELPLVISGFGPSNGAGPGGLVATGDTTEVLQQHKVTHSTEGALAMAGEVIYSRRVGWKFLQNIGLKLLLFHLYKSE